MSPGSENDRTEDERIDKIKDRLQQIAGGQLVAAEFDGLDGRSAARDPRGRRHPDMPWDPKAAFDALADWFGR